MNLEARCLVVGLDFSETGSRALDQALALAKGSSGGDLHVVHVANLPIAPIGAEFGWEDPGVSLAAATDRLRRQVEQVFEASSGGTAFDRVTLHVKVGPPAEGIARLAAEVDADMIVIGTHGRRGLRRLVLGSVAEATIRLAGCPVLVVRPKDHTHEAEAASGWELGVPVAGRT